MAEFKINKYNKLGFDIIMVEAPQGKGKTSFCCSVLSQDYKYHHKWRTKQATKFSNWLNKDYGYNLHINNNHLYFSNIEMYLNEACTVRTWACDFSRFAMPNDDFEVDYFPPYSVLFFTELDVQAFCRNWQQFSDYYIFLFKYFRHMRYTIIFDLQSGQMVDKTIRILKTLTIYIKQADNIESLFLHRIKGRVTKFKMSRPSDMEASRDMRKIKGSDKFGDAKNMVHKYKGNIFKQYNSFSAIPYFLYKIKDWTFKEHETVDLTPEGVERYVKVLHPLSSNKKQPKQKTNKQNTSKQNTKKEKVAA